MSKPAELRGPDWLRQTGRFRARKEAPRTSMGTSHLAPAATISMSCCMTRVAGTTPI